jgi:hypothetical protein
VRIIFAFNDNSYLLEVREIQNCVMIVDIIIIFGVIDECICFCELINCTDINFIVL